MEAAKSFPDPFAVPGDTEKPWYSIGPNDDAGRSRAALWDLSDGSYQRVFAGGISGGLWKNENIINSLSPWSRSFGVPGEFSCLNYYSRPRQYQYNVSWDWRELYRWRCLRKWYI